MKYKPKVTPLFERRDTKQFYGSFQNTITTTSRGWAGNWLHISPLDAKKIVTALEIDL